MQSLRSIEDITIQDKVPIHYLVAAFPEWEFYDAANCPQPILDWLAVEYPNINVEQVRLDGRYWRLLNDDAAVPFLSNDELPTPIFRLDLTDEQAQAFDVAWSDPARQPAGGKVDFLFITVQPQFPPEWREIG